MLGSYDSDFLSKANFSRETELYRRFEATSIVLIYIYIYVYVYIYIDTYVGKYTYTKWTCLHF